MSDWALPSKESITQTFSSIKSNIGLSSALGLPTIPGLPPMSRESQDYNARFSAPLPTKIPLDNESGSGLMSKLSSFINDLPKTVADKVDTVSKTATSYAQAPGNTIKSMENLQSELQTLNKQTTEMIRYLRETADNSRRNIDAINSLNGDLFRF